MGVVLTLSSVQLPSVVNVYLIYVSVMRLTPILAKPECAPVTACDSAFGVRDFIKPARGSFDCLMSYLRAKPIPT